MSDEARLVVELLEKGNGGAATSAQYAQPGAANVPGSSIASDFQQKVSDQGAGASAGVGSAPAPTAPFMPSPTVAPSTQPHDPMVDVTRGLIRDNPTASGAEIQSALEALGVASKKARDLFDQVSGVPPTTTQQAPPPLQPSDVMLPPVAGGSGYTPGFDPMAPFEAPQPTPPVSQDEIDRRRQIEQFGEQVRRNNLNPQEEYDAQVKRLQDALSGGSLDQEFYDRAERQARERYNRQMESLNPPSPTGDDKGSLSDAAALDNLFRTSGGKAALSALGGPLGASVGELGSTALRNLPALAELTPSGLGALYASGGLAAVAGPIGAGVAVAAAAVAVPAAAAYTMLNEAERARAIVKDYSPEAAMAEGEAQVRKIQADLKTSERLGDEVAAYVGARSRLSATSQGIRDRIAEPVLQDFSNFLKAVNQLGTAVEAIGGETGILAKLGKQLPYAFGLAGAAYAGVASYGSTIKEETSPTFDLMSDYPFLAPSEGKFSGMKATGETTGEFAPIPGLDF